jgi:hypothetical protein
VRWENQASEFAAVNQRVSDLDGGVVVLRKHNIQALSLRFNLSPALFFEQMCRVC